MALHMIPHNADDNRVCQYSEQADSIAYEHQANFHSTGMMSSAPELPPRCGCKTRKAFLDFQHGVLIAIRFNVRIKRKIPESGAQALCVYI